MMSGNDDYGDDDVTAEHDNNERHGEYDYNDDALMMMVIQLFILLPRLSTIIK